LWSLIEPPPRKETPPWVEPMSAMRRARTDADESAHAYSRVRGKVKERPRSPGRCREQPGGLKAVLKATATI
jgi:hypothetical protein